VIAGGGTDALTGRASLMAERIGGTLLRNGLDDQGIRTVLHAIHAALTLRQRAITDDHHPDFLHPGRTLLILLEDLGVTDPVVLAAGALAESLRPPLRTPPPADDEPAGAAVRRLLEAVPYPGADEELLLESLLAADHEVQLIALAERLDHVRHLHLAPRNEWHELHARTCSTYLPVAPRVHPTLARRYQWWCATFARRFLTAPSTAAHVDPTTRPS